MWPVEGDEEPLRAAGGFVDVDQDGLLDVLFASEANGLFLFRNAGNGGFEAAPLPAVKGPTAIAAADYDNDGDTDLFVTSTTVAGLLRNDGTGVFQNVAATAGVAAKGTSAAVTFADFDADGWLDLYVGRQPVPGDNAVAANLLYRNLRNGRFEDVTSAASVGGLGKTMAVVASDVDGDGYPDLLVCNDVASGLDGNIVYKNSGSSTAGMTGRFSALGTVISFDCLGGGAGDYDRDGDTDYYWAAIGNNILWKNAAGVFTDVATAQTVTLAKDSCTSQTTASWEAGFHDLDADGWLDLYVSNGGAVPGVAVAPHSPNALLRNNAGLNFTDVALSAGAADPRRGRGVAFGDYDRDGDIDILQLNANGAPQLLKNQTVTTNSWAALALRGTVSNSDGVGAQVLWRTQAWTRLDERRVTSGTSGPSEPRLLTGLGTAQEAHAEIAWPSGTNQRLFYLSRNANTEVVEPALTIGTGSLGAASVKQGTTVTVNLTLSAAASGGTYSVRLFTAGNTVAPATLATPVLATNTATLRVTVALGAATGPATLVVRVTDDEGGKDEQMLPLTITVP